MYSTEICDVKKFFSSQCEEIRGFLRLTADGGYNEHFHLGRFDWMMAHPMLDRKKLTDIALFRKGDKLVGAALFDTVPDDRWYLIHSVSDENLLSVMIEYVLKNDGKKSVIKANLKDTNLCTLLENARFKMRYTETVLETELTLEKSCPLPDGFYLNAKNSETDERQRMLVIHRGFGNDGLPLACDDSRIKTNDYTKVFAIKNGIYAAHCGIWYYGGKTAYVEPVVTVPEYRQMGLGRAVVYEALRRVKERGAERAIVLSSQDFYLKIGLTKSSEVGTFTK